MSVAEVEIWDDADLLGYRESTTAGERGLGKVKEVAPDQARER